MKPFVKQQAPTQGGVLRPYEPFLMTLLRVLDALLGVALFFGFINYFNVNPLHIREAAILIFFTTILCLHSVGLYRSWRFSAIRQEIIQICSGCFVLYMLLFFVSYILDTSGEFSRSLVISWMIVWPIVISLERVLIRFILRRYRKKGRNVRMAVVAGYGVVAEQLAHLIAENPWSGTRLLGVFDDKEKKPLGDVPFLGNLNALPEYAKKRHLDIVYIVLPLKAESKIQLLLRELADSMTAIYIIPDLFFIDMMLGGSLIFFEGLPIVALRDSPIRGINTLFKRSEDLILASLILILAIPLFIIIALVIKFTSSGPVLFKQWRYGLNGQAIKIYKFRTMTVCEDGYNFTQAVKDDVRVTAFGSFLRRTSLDELPQFFNVIQGRISLVGPRPHPVAMNEEYRKLVPGYMLRHKVKPGITGLAQINGFRGQTDTVEKMEKRVKYDLEYLRQWSILLDLQIIVKTIITGAWKNNAY